MAKLMRQNGFLETVTSVFSLPPWLELQISQEDWDEFHTF